MRLCYRRNIRGIIFFFFRQPSTFQAVLASDGCDTYVIYLYEEFGMLWDTALSENNNVLIGYTNGGELAFNEIQGNYRPDQRNQSNG